MPETTLRLMPKAILRLAFVAAFYCTAALAGTVTYYYTGSNFTTCTYGTCPANYTSDHIVASVSFDSLLAANLPLTNYFSSPHLLGWTLGDALGYFSESSVDANAAAELTDLIIGNPALKLSTNSSGGIANYRMDGPKGGMFQPAPIPPYPAGTTGADFVEINLFAPDEWDAISLSPGQWSPATPTPEPATLMLLVAGLGVIGIRRGRMTRSQAH